MDRDKFSVYVTGPNGVVGWLAGWSYDQSDSTLIKDITLSLDHRKAITFFNGVKEDEERSLAISSFIRNHSEVYGVAHCFAW